MFIAQISDGHAFGPLVVIRATQALLIGAVIIVDPSGVATGRAASSRRSPPSACSTWPATASSSSRSRSGALAVAAVLSSLYPVTTVILATVVLRERVTRSHAVGIALAVAAIACIAAGST